MQEIGIKGEGFGKNYSLPTDWSEITLDDAIRISKVLHRIPDKLREMYSLQIKEDTEENSKKLDKLMAKLTLKDQMKTFPKWYGEVIGAFGQIPKKVMSQCIWSERVAIYQALCQNMAMGLMYWPYDIAFGTIDSFKWEDETLMLPETKDKLGTDWPMDSTTAIEFAESADLEIAAKEMEGGKWNNAKWIVAILCRPKGEAYDEDTALVRGKTMGTLTMDIVYQVFFCGIERMRLLNKHLGSYLNQMGHSPLKPRLELGSSATAGT